MKTIVSLAGSRIKYHKSRTLLTAMAIMLTTTLLMGLGTSAVGLLDINRRQASAQSNVHAVFTHLTLEQAQILQNHMDIEAVEINELFAEIKYEKMNAYLTYNRSLRDGIYHGVGNVTEGHKAETADEICGSAAFFERMGVEPVIGNRITISFRPNGEGAARTREFTICGIVSQNDISKLNVSDSRIVYSAEVSEALVKEYLAPEEREISANIRVLGEAQLNYDEISEKIKAVAADIGCEDVNIRLNEEYLIGILGLGSETVRIVEVIALLIMVFSGLVIYSIYYVGVITDVQEIGKLKSLGASKRQIKRMLLLEGACVSAIALPFGLVLGYAIPYFILPLFMKKAQENSMSVYSVEHIRMFSLPVPFVVTGAILITVAVSLLKPMHMAGRISPVEAIRYQEGSGSRKLRRGRKHVDVFSLSAANLYRNKKRTIVTMVTMGLSCVLFMSLAGLMNSMSAEDIARRNIAQGDFKLYLECKWNDREYPENNFDSLQLSNFFSEEFVSEIEQIDGVENVVRSKMVLISSEYPSLLFDEGRRVNMSAFDREKAKKYQKEIKQGELDYDKMLAENGAIFTSDYFMKEYALEIGDQLLLTVYDGDRQIPLEITVMASMDDAESYFLIPKEIFDGLGLEFDSTQELYITADKKKYDSVKTAMQEISDSNEYFRLYSMDEELEIGRLSVNMIKYPMYLVLIMVAVISFMNLINTMITSIVTRKRELGVLQAIGLSNRQLAGMLAGEGAVFTIGTLLLSATVGNVLGYLVFCQAKENHFMSVSAYHYPVWETVGLVLILVFGQLMISGCISRKVRRESLIDRIRSE